MITKASHTKLSKKHYVRKALQSRNYWFDFSEGKLKTYLKTTNNFNIIIYSELDDPEHYYIIPYEILKPVFIEQYMSHDKLNRRRWIGNIIDHNLKVSNYPDAIDVSKYYLRGLNNNSQPEKRISRLTWNENGWVMPSGPLDKSKHPETHEAKYGYGHEEWIFDTGKLIQGYHYGFLESVRKEQDAYSGNIYDVWLYSINSDTKKRFWIGEIKNLVVIDRAEADAAYDSYAKKGWIKEMEEQIRLSGANEKGFSNWKGVDVFNVKFKPNSILVNDPYFQLPDNHPIIGKPRYFFGHFRDDYSITIGNDGDNFEFTSSPDNHGSNSDPQKKTHIRQPKSVEIIYWHKAISDSLTRVLRQEHGPTNVTREHLAGYGTNKIDIVVKGENHLTFYEIKTYNSIRTSIREALGQLLEYCFYPNKEKAKELIIVTHIPADSQTKIYLKHLRDNCKLSIYYQSYDLETKSLSEKW